MSNKKQSPKSGETRRKFLKKTGTVAATAAVLKIPVYAGNKAPSANVKGANEKIVVGYVGVGGRKVAEAFEFGEDGRVVRAIACYGV